MKVLLVRAATADEPPVTPERFRTAWPEAEMGEVHSGPELERALASQWYDVILLGYALEWADGLDALRTIRGCQPNTPVIVVTAAGSEEIAVQALQAGAQDYLTPATLERLPQAIQGCIDAARQRRNSPPSIHPIDPDAEKVLLTLKSLLDTPSDLVLLLDTDGKLIFANDTFLRRAGRTPETIVGCRLADVLPAELAEKRQEVVDQVARSGEAVRYEDRGVVGWYDITVYPIFDAAEQVSRVAVVARDITERKHVEEALQNSYNTIQALIDAPASIVIVIDNQGRIVVISENLAAQLGYTRQELVGRLIRDVVPGIELYLREQYYWKVMQTKEPTRFETQWGKTVLDIVIFPILGNAGEIEQLAYIARDITQTKAVEEALRQSQVQLQAAVQAQEMAGIELARRVEERTAELAQANRELQSAVQRAESLTQIAARLNAPTTLSEVAQAMCDEALKVSSYPSACLLLMVEDSDDLKPAAASGAYRQQLLTLSPITVDQYEEHFRDDGPVYIHPDANASPEMSATAFVRESGLRTIVIFRLTNAGVPLGVLCLLSYGEVKLPTEDELNLLQGLAEVGSTAIARAWLFHQVVDSRGRLQTLSRKLVEIQDIERRNIAVELHDQVGQMLTSLKISLERIGRSVQGGHFPPGSPVIKEVDMASQQVQTVLGQVRQLSLELRPPMLDELGLLPSLLTYVDKFCERTGAQVDFRHSGLYGRLDSAIEKALYRMVQEGLTNVVRHSGTKEASVRILLDKTRLVAQVRDQGKGFDSDIILNERPSTGLSGMAERIALCGGELTIESEPGKGTCLTAEFTLQPGNEEPIEISERGQQRSNANE